MTTKPRDSAQGRRFCDKASAAGQRAQIDTPLANYIAQVAPLDLTHDVDAFEKLIPRAGGSVRESGSLISTPPRALSQTLPDHLGFDRKSDNDHARVFRINCLTDRVCQLSDSSWSR